MPASLKDQIMADMKSAMKNKDQSRLQALKLVYADCKNQEIELQKDLTDVQVISVLKKQIKHYEESIAQFKQAGRSEDAKDQEQRKDVIHAYLPEPLSTEELKKIVDEMIVELKADSMKQMGGVIKAVQSKTAGRVDNKSLVELVKERLQNR